MQGRLLLEHSNHIVKVGVEATCQHFNPDVYSKKQPNQRAHLELCHSNSDTHERVLNLDCIIQLKCGEMRSHASFKTARTWKSFNNRGTKIFLLSEELWLIANNSKSFENGSKSVRRNNLDLCKHSEIYVI